MIEGINVGIGSLETYFGLIGSWHSASGGISAILALTTMLCGRGETASTEMFCLIACPVESVSGIHPSM